MEVREYPNFLGGIVGIGFSKIPGLSEYYCLTLEEWKGIKDILGKDYLNSTEEEFKRAYMAELI
jgi:hypothetical protein